MRVIVVFATVVFFASACSGSVEVQESAVRAATEPVVVQLKGPVAIDGAGFEATASLSTRLVDRLGDADTATDALLIAAEKGYSGPQILAGVEAGKLLADGTVESVSPASSPLSRIDLPEKSGQQSVRAKPVKRALAANAKLVHVQDDKILLERLRSSASEGIDAFERNELRGLQGVLLILVLLGAGATPEQVIDVLILGAYFYEENGICYSQSLPISSSNPPDSKPCDGSQLAPADEAMPERSEPEPEADVATELAGASYAGELGDVSSGFSASSIVVTISPDGLVSGSLTATEELENYLASVNVACGLFADSEEERAEECADSVVECPATVLWSSDLAGLQFVGQPPDDGTVSGEVSLVWDTTPHGCGEPSSETQTFEITATVSPEGAQITVPFLIELERVAPPS